MVAWVDALAVLSTGTCTANFHRRSAVAVPTLKAQQPQLTSSVLRRHRYEAVPVFSSSTPFFVTQELLSLSRRHVHVKKTFCFYLDGFLICLCSYFTFSLLLFFVAEVLVGVAPSTSLHHLDVLGIFIKNEKKSLFCSSAASTGENISDENLRRRRRRRWQRRPRRRGCPSLPRMRPIWQQRSQGYGPRLASSLFNSALWRGTAFKLGPLLAQNPV